VSAEADGDATADGQVGRRRRSGVWKQGLACRSEGVGGGGDGMGAWVGDKHVFFCQLG
jgi:hypothetical protein